MRKKLTSFLLAASLLGQSTSCIPVSANNANERKQESLVSENVPREVLIGAAGLGIVCIAGIPIIYHLTHSKNDDVQNNDPHFRQALKEAVCRLFKENQREVFDFPCDYANYRKDAFAGNDRSAIEIAIALNAAFRKHLGTTAEARILGDEELFDELVSKVPKNESVDLKNLILDRIVFAKKIVTELCIKTPPILLDETPLKPIKDVVLSRLTIHNDLAEEIGRARQVPVVSIHWSNNMCWFIATILLFYHYKPMRDLIMNLNINTTKERLKQLHDTDEDKKTRKNLEAMMLLTIAFRKLNGGRERRSDYTPQCVTFNPRFEELLLRTIREACILNQGAREYLSRMQYAQYGDLFAPRLLEIVKNAAEATNTAWNKDSFTLEGVANGGYFKNDPDLRMLNSDLCSRAAVRSHNWIRIKHNDQTLAIGEKLDDADSIAPQLSTEGGEESTSAFTQYFNTLPEYQKTSLSELFPANLFTTENCLFAPDFEPSAGEKSDVIDTEFGVLYWIAKAIREEQGALDHLNTINLPSLLACKHISSKQLPTILMNITNQASDIKKTVLTEYLKGRIKYYNELIDKAKADDEKSKDELHQYWLDYKAAIEHLIPHANRAEIEPLYNALLRNYQEYINPKSGEQPAAPSKDDSDPSGGAPAPGGTPAAPKPEPKPNDGEKTKGSSSAVSSSSSTSVPAKPAPTTAKTLAEQNPLPQPPKKPLPTPSALPPKTQPAPTTKFLDDMIKTHQEKIKGLFPKETLNQFCHLIACSNSSDANIKALNAQLTVLVTMSDFLNKTACPDLTKDLLIKNFANTLQKSGVENVTEDVLRDIFENAEKIKNAWLKAQVDSCSQQIGEEHKNSVELMSLGLIPPARNTDSLKAIREKLEALNPLINDPAVKEQCTECESSCAKLIGSIETIMKPPSDESSASASESESENEDGEVDASATFSSISTSVPTETASTSAQPMATTRAQGALAQPTMLNSTASAYRTEPLSEEEKDIAEFDRLSPNVCKIATELNGIPLEDEYLETLVPKVKELGDALPNLHAHTFYINIGDKRLQQLNDYRTIYRKAKGFVSQSIVSKQSYLKE